MTATPRKLRAVKTTESAAVVPVAVGGALESLFGASAEKTYAYAREQLTSAAKAGETAAQLGKANLDAALDVGNALVAGAQGFGRLWMDVMHGAVDDGIGAARRLATCRTTKDVIDAQGEIARASYRKFASESHKLSAFSTKFAGDISAPIVARIDSAVDAAAKATVRALAKPFAA